MLYYFNGKYSQVSVLLETEIKSKMAERHYTHPVISVDTVIRLCLIDDDVLPLSYCKICIAHSLRILVSDISIFVWICSYQAQLLYHYNIDMGSRLFCYVLKSFELPTSKGVLWLFVFCNCCSNRYYIYLLFLSVLLGVPVLMIVVLVLVLVSFTWLSITLSSEEFVNAANKFGQITPLEIDILYQLSGLHTHSG